jgi:hypothetical protein
MKLKNIDELKTYIDVEKVTSGDLLIFKVNLNIDDDDYMLSTIEQIIMDSKSILDELGIKVLFIPQSNDVNVEVSTEWPEDKLLEEYAKQQNNIGRKDGFMKALNDVDIDSEYNDNVKHKNHDYLEGYKQGYKMGWDTYT